MANITGQCKCGAIHYASAPDIKMVVNCHCHMCRSMNGAAFSTYVVVPEDTFSVVAGKEHLAAYPVTENATKHFCGVCGTPLFNRNPGKFPGVRMLHLGTLDATAELKPGANVFRESRLAWTDAVGDAANFDRAPDVGG